MCLVEWEVATWCELRVVWSEDRNDDLPDTAHQAHTHAELKLLVLGEEPIVKKIGIDQTHF